MPKPIARNFAVGLISIAFVTVISFGVYLCTKKATPNKKAALDGTVQADLARSMEQLQKTPILGEMANAMQGMMGGPDGMKRYMLSIKMTPLHYAAQVGNLEILQKALSEGISPNANDIYKQAPLHYAVMSQEGTPVILPLVKAGADINVLLNNGWTPLMSAIGKKNKKAAMVLLEAGADINVVDYIGQTALVLALYTQDNEIVMKQVEAGVNVNEPDVKGLNPLLLSSDYCEEKTSLAILHAGAIVDARNEQAMHYAASSKGTKLLRALLVAGAKVDVRNNSNATPLHTVAKSGTWEMAELLLSAKADITAKASNGWTVLHFATDNPKLIHDFVKSGADINAEASDGRRPLHIAVNNGNLEAIKTLLGMSAKVNIRDKQGWSPLMMAVGWDSNIHEALVHAGAKEESWTPLHLAAINGDIATLRKLLDSKDSNINQVDKAGRTPLRLACYCGENSLECVQLLLDAKAKVNIADNSGNGPLHIACYLENEAMTVALLKAGADTNVKNDEGLTPLHVICLSTNLNIVKKLVEAGTNVNASTNLGDAPLHLLYNQTEFSFDRDEIALFLVEQGAKLRSQNKEGLTVLDILPDLTLKKHAHRARFELNEALFKSLLESKNKSPLSNQQTPAGTLKRLIQATLWEDKEAFLSCFQGTERQTRMFAIVYEVAQANLAFRKAVLSKYGKEGWFFFNDGKGFSIQLPIELSQIRSDQISIYKNNALFTGKARVFPEKHRLTRGNDGKWRINADGEKITLLSQELYESQSTMSVAMKNLSQKIEQTDITLEQIDKEAMGILFGYLGKKNRETF